MTPEWLKMKEQDQVRVRDQKICEEKAIEKLLQEKRLKVISKGEECDYQRILCIAREEMEEKENLTREKRMNEQAHWELEWTEKLAEEVSGLKSKCKNKDNIVNLIIQLLPRSKVTFLLRRKLCSPLIIFW